MYFRLKNDVMFPPDGSMVLAVIEYEKHNNRDSNQIMLSNKDQLVLIVSCIVDKVHYFQQEAFEKCWAHSPLRAAARPFTRCRYCRTRASMSTTTTTTTTTTTRDRGDRYGPIEWAQLSCLVRA